MVKSAEPTSTAPPSHHSFTSHRASLAAWTISWSPKYFFLSTILETDALVEQNPLHSNLETKNSFKPLARFSLYQDDKQQTGSTGEKLPAPLKESFSYPYRPLGVILLSGPSCFQVMSSATGKALSENSFFPLFQWCRQCWAPTYTPFCLTNSCSLTLTINHQFAVSKQP